jgi:hypothetical protein
VANSRQRTALLQSQGACSPNPNEEITDLWKNALFLIRLCCYTCPRLNGSRYTIAQKEEVMQWLLEASRFWHQTSKEQVSLNYKTYMLPPKPPGDPAAKKGIPHAYWQGYMIKVGTQIWRR